MTKPHVWPQRAARPTRTKKTTDQDGSPGNKKYNKKSLLGHDTINEYYQYGFQSTYMIFQVKPDVVAAVVIDPHVLT